jgi:hypothetical protein
MSHHCLVESLPYAADVTGSTRKILQSAPEQRRKL